MASSSFVIRFGLEDDSTPSELSPCMYGNYRRFNKGHQSHTLPNSYVVIDLETTGLSPRCDEIIEFAAVKVVGGEIVSTFQELAKPVERISGFITSITGITNEMVESARPTCLVYRDFIDFIGDFVLIGHNVNFDINFLYDYGCKCTPEVVVSNDFVDTLKVAKLKHQGLECYKLAFLCDTFALNSESGYHRALFDCQQTNKLYKFLKADLSDEVWTELCETRRASRRRWHESINYKALTATVSPGEIDKDNPFYGKVVVFTGALERFQRKDACQIVANLGGVPAGGVTKKTDFLVLGNNDYCRSITNPEHKSSKQLKAELLAEDGGAIRIIPEDVFYEMIESDD